VFALLRHQINISAIQIAILVLSIFSSPECPQADVSRSVLQIDDFRSQLFPSVRQDKIVEFSCSHVSILPWNPALLFTSHNADVNLRRTASLDRPSGTFVGPGGIGGAHEHQSSIQVHL
jgi:hypothetical protein